MDRVKKCFLPSIILSAAFCMLGITTVRAEVCFLPDADDCQRVFSVDLRACKKWSETTRNIMCGSKKGYYKQAQADYNCGYAEEMGDICCPGWIYCTERNCKQEGYTLKAKPKPENAYLECEKCKQGNDTYYKCPEKPCNYDSNTASTLKEKCGVNGPYCLKKYADCPKGQVWVADDGHLAGKETCGKCSDAMPDTRCAGTKHWEDELPGGCVTCTQAGEVNGRGYYCCTKMHDYPISERQRNLSDGICHQYEGPIVATGSEALNCYKQVEKDCGNDNQYLTSSSEGCYCRDYKYEFDAEPTLLKFNAAGKAPKTGDTVTVTSTRAHMDGSNLERNKYEILSNDVTAKTGCQLVDDTIGSIKVVCRKNASTEESRACFVVRHVHTVTKTHPELSKEICIEVEGDKCPGDLVMNTNRCTGNTKAKLSETKSVSGENSCYECLDDSCPDETWKKCPEEGKNCRQNDDGYETEQTKYGNYCYRAKTCKEPLISKTEIPLGKENCYKETAVSSGEDSCFKHKDPLVECPASDGKVWDEDRCGCVSSSEPGDKPLCFDEVWGEEKVGRMEDGKIIGGNVYIAPDGKKTYKEVPENPCVELGTKVYKREYVENGYVFDFNKCQCQVSKCPKSQGYYDSAPTGCYDCQKENVNGRECFKCKTFDEAFGGNWVESTMLGVCWDGSTEKVAADRETRCLKTKECECPATHPNEEKPKCFDEVMGVVDQNEYHIGGLTCYKDVTECLGGQKRDETTCQCKPNPNTCPDGTFNSEAECQKGNGCFDCVKRTAEDDAKYGELTCYERAVMFNFRTAEDWTAAKFCYNEASKKQSANNQACYEKAECQCPGGTSSAKPNACYDKYADSEIKKKEVTLANGTVCYPTDEPKCDESIGEYYDYNECECVPSGCLDGQPYAGYPNICAECTSTGQMVKDTNGKTMNCWKCGSPEAGFGITEIGGNCIIKKLYNRYDSEGEVNAGIYCFKQGKVEVTAAECVIKDIVVSQSAASVTFAKYIRATTLCEAEGSTPTTAEFLIGNGSIATNNLDSCQDGKISFTDKIEYKGNNYICHVDKEYAPDCPQVCTEKCPQNTYWEDEIPNKDALGEAWRDAWVNSGKKVCDKACYKANDNGCPNCISEDKISGCKQCTFVMYSGTKAMYKCTDLNPVDYNSYADEFKDKSALTIKSDGRGWVCKQVGALDTNGISKSNSECCAPKACEGENVYAGSANKGEEINPNGCKVYVDEEEQCHHCALTGYMSGNYSCYRQHVDPVCDAYGKNAHPYQNEDEAKKGMGCNKVKYVGDPSFCRDYAHCYKCEEDQCPDCVTEDEISGCKQCTFFGYSGSTALYKCTDLNPVITINKGSDGWTCKPVGIIDSNGSSKGGSECCAPNACTNPDYPYAGRADNGANRNPDGCKEYIDAEEKCHYCVTGTGGMSGNYVCYSQHVSDNPVCAHHGADVHPYKDEAAAKKGMACKNVEIVGKLGICYRLVSCYRCKN